MPRYPPSLSEWEIELLIDSVKDRQILNGSVLKLVKFEQLHTVQSQPVGTTLFPTIFPRSAFENALSLQKTYNKLYASVTRDTTWLHSVLKDVIEEDPLARTLWDIYERVTTDNEGYVGHDLELGIWRSDYMLHDPAPKENDTNFGGDIEIKQIEFNTIACAGGIHANVISDTHRYLQNVGSLQTASDDPLLATLKPSQDALPRNHTLNTIVKGLRAAHDAYGPSMHGRRKCILMIVQPFNFNIADERPIEYALMSGSHPEEISIPTFRVEFGYQILEQTTFANPGSILTYTHLQSREVFEVSVIYFRAGFQHAEYADDQSGLGATVREHLEKSRAIKCPTVLGHLATFKHVQQALTLPGVLERWLSESEAALIRKTFMPIYSLKREQRVIAYAIAVDVEQAKDYVLKPCKEGGGNNVYGADIPPFLAAPETSWTQFILMEKASFRVKYAPSWGFLGYVYSEYKRMAVLGLVKILREDGL